MIHEIASTLPTFKGLTFRPGLNIVIAEKSPGATIQHTRNAAGKSSIVDTIRFLTGGNCDPDSMFRNETLVDHSFRIRLDVCEETVCLERTGDEPSRVRILEGNVDKWPISPTHDDEIGVATISATNLNASLSQLVFGLRDEPTGSWSEKYKPTFRSLLSYFLRQERSGGFRHHAKTFTNAQGWTGEVNVSFLIGLDWTIPQQWQFVRDRKDELTKLKKAAKQGVLGDIVGRSRDIRAKLVLAEERSKELKGRIGQFNLLPEYREKESNVAEATKQLGSLSNDNTADRYLLKRLHEAMNSEAPPSIGNLKELYEEARVVIPEAAIRRFEEVRKFHESVIRNRKTYLEGEITDANSRVSTREKEMARLQDRRTEVVGFLKSHGALDQLERLHEELGREHARVEVLKEKYEIAHKVEKGSAELKIEEGKLSLRLQQDFEEQDAVIREAIVSFEEISKQLYGKGGTFSPETTQKGPKFEISISAKDSPGIANMQVFCFDLMLMQLCSNRAIGPGFLVHDSHLFDPVDKRQVASALKVGAAMAEKCNWQYIVTLNSDQLPTEQDTPEDFEIEKFFVPVRLSDESETGGLFGCRFD